MDLANQTTLTLAPATDASWQAASEDGEAALVRRLRTGEPEAFAEMVRVHSGHLMAVARGYLGQEADAEDAVQEALLKAFSCFHQFKGESLLSTWLHRIVVNAALMNRRSRSRKRERLFENDEAVGTVALQIDPRCDDPAERALHSSIHDARLVADHIRRLPECHRTVMELRLIQHRSTADAARELGLTPAALKTKLHRAKAGLHRALAHDPECALG